MKKIFIISYGLLMFFVGVNVDAIAIEDEYKIRTNRISVQNNVADLYVTFENEREAFSTLKEKACNLIEFIKNKYNYEIIDSSNIENYLEKYYEDYEIIDNKFPDEGMELINFYDIFENKQKNVEILKDISNYQLSHKTFIKDDLKKILPFNDNDIEKNITVQSFDICKGQQYAIDHATNPNKNEYAYFPRGDCANFASQILEKSGVKQVTSNSVLSGWWHKRNNKKNTQSNSWSLADVFVRYMGVGYKTSDHGDFSAHLKSGDFIAVDGDSDGDWDHIGFLVDYNPNGVCYGPNNCYNDYRVAQHTKNYNEWVTSEKNNWENRGKKGGTYARVRR